MDALGLSTDLAKPFEGLKLRAYICPAGKLTIGWGHVITACDRLTWAHVPIQITEQKAEQLLQDDMRAAQKAVRDLVHVPLNINEQAALMDFVFNLGRTAFAGSLLLHLLNSNLKSAAAEQFERWDHATVGGVIVELKGLKERRLAERDLFLKPVRVGPNSVALHSN